MGNVLTNEHLHLNIHPALRTYDTYTNTANAGMNIIWGCIHVTTVTVEKQ